MKKRIKTDFGPADYTGTVNRDGAPHGRGSWKVVEGDYKGTIYDGIFANGKREGFSKLTWSDGEVHAGEYKADLKIGFTKV